MARTFRLGLTLIAGIALAGCFGAKSDTGSSGSTSSTSQGTTAHGNNGSSSTTNTSTSASSGTQATSSTNATNGSTGSDFGTSTNGSNGTIGVASDIGTSGTSSTTASTFGSGTSGTVSAGSTGSTATFGNPTIGSSGGTTGNTTGSTGHTSGSTGHATGGSTGAVSTSGTTGFSGTSTGSTSGTTGTGDCRSAGCGYGESCTALPSSAGTIWSCTCTQGDGTAGSDSCSGNPNGNTVCDPNSNQCSKPTDYGPCTPGATDPCAAGYTCVAYPGGGYCLQSCSTTDQCNLSYSQCQQGYCQVDYCGPNNFGLPQNGNFYGPCDLADAGDGYCQPFGDGQGGVIGYCMGTGTAQNGDPCPGFGVKGDSECAPGEVCYGLGLHYRDGGAANECFTDCDANQPNQCSGNSACFPYDSHAQTSPDPGYCFPP